MAHSQRPARSGNSASPAKGDDTTPIRPSMAEERKSDKPPGKCSTELGGVSPLMRGGARGAGRRCVLDEGRVARPADSHAAEQVGLGAAQPVEPGRDEFRLAEDFSV